MCDAIEIELVVCTTCRMSADGTGAQQPLRDGARLSAALSARGIPHVRQECLSACRRGCVVVLRGRGRWTYLQGGLDPDCDLDALETMTAAYRAAPAGFLPWRERPESLRRNIIARIPPMEPKNEP
ncbi:DUF1636 domain-containing protein [Pontibaca methylaminivorans]|uniref:DUF1636 domain-containing protein n=1 Tax=Pontibaca methylaminivorans TaxID=515897 RepID=UPI002FDA8462